MEENKINPSLAITKEVAILFDGKQFMVKIPKEISDFYDLKKGKKIRLVVKPITKGKGQNYFEIIS